MDLLDKEKAIESQFAHDNEMLFKVRAHRNKLAGIWAAQKMKINAKPYSEELVASLYNKRELYERLRSDFAKHKTKITDVEIITKINEYVVQSRKEIIGE